MAKPRTPFEYHEELLKRCGGVDPSKCPVEISFSLTWVKALPNPHPDSKEESALGLGHLRAISEGHNEDVDVFLND